MASIKIAELRPAGSELFQDSESFLNELNDSHEMAHVLGGGRKNGGNHNLQFTYNVNVQSYNANTINANTYGNVNTVYNG